MKALLRFFFLVAPTVLLLMGDAVGVWQGQMDLGAKGRRDVTLTLKQDGSKVTGSLALKQGTRPTGGIDKVEILDGRIDGNEVSFAVSTGAMDMPRWEFHGNVDGDALRLVISGKLDGVADTIKVGEVTLARER